MKLKSLSDLSCLRPKNEDYPNKELPPEVRASLAREATTGATLSCYRLTFASLGEWALVFAYGIQDAFDIMHTADQEWPVDGRGTECRRVQKNVHEDRGLCWIGEFGEDGA